VRLTKHVIQRPCGFSTRTVSASTSTAFAYVRCTSSRVLPIRMPEIVLIAGVSVSRPTTAPVASSKTCTSP